MAEEQYALHVDDDAMMSKLVRAVLERAGYKVASARNTIGALRALFETPPSVILLDDDQLPRLPLPIRGHPARRVAILTLHAELPGCGGSAGRAGHHRLLRNHPAVGRLLRPADRRRSAPPALPAALDLAPRRNGRVDRWPADVSLARRRCRRRDPRRARSD